MYKILRYGIEALNLQFRFLDIKFDIDFQTNTIFKIKLLDEQEDLKEKLELAQTLWA